MESLVSILIPAYNAEDWIAETIESALGQTWKRKEIIVVDDGSTDQTLAIARRFASRDVSVVTQSNQGASAARNNALSISQGDYIQWLDADDLLARDKIEQQIKVLHECPSKRTLLSGAWGRFIHRVSKAEFLPTALWGDLSPVEWLLRKLGQNLQMQTDNWLISRELTEAAGPWDARLWRDNDGEYLCRVIIASDGIKFVPDAKSYYRISGFNSVSYIGRSNKKLESLFLSMQLHIGYLRGLEDSERTRAACLKYLQTWLIDFYPYRLDIVRQLKQIASELGGELEEPRLSWKYGWILKLFGWTLAKEAQLVMPYVRKTLVMSWDKALFRLEKRKRPHNHEV
ncbi:MAG: glycosyltransferase family 2 protein [Verrucomicrobia bacterium]|nr:glycosyltransferase family 2 protein [Verrucomicrobiota bacterium]